MAQRHAARAAPSTVPGACTAERCWSAQLRPGPRHRNGPTGSGEPHWVLKANDRHQGTQLPWTPRPVGLLGHPEPSLSVLISSGPAFGGLC